MIRELDTVVLTGDMPEHGLMAGDVGAVVHVYDDGRSFEVEFVAGNGKTVALITLEAGDIGRYLPVSPPGSGTAPR